MHHSFATWALDAGLSTFDLSRYMGTPVVMIDRTYGHLAQGAEQTHGRSSTRPTRFV